MWRIAWNEKSGDSLAMDISALAISGGSTLSERTKLERDLFVEGFGSGKKRVLVDGSAGLKDVEERMDSSPPEDWRSWMTGGRSLSLFRVTVGRVGEVEVVAVVVVVVVGGGKGVVKVICLSSSSSLALVVVAMMLDHLGRSDRLQLRLPSATMDGDSPTTLVPAKAAPSASALFTDSVTAATTSFKTPTQTIHNPEVILPLVYLP